jgi:hypothetical protein
MTKRKGRALKIVAGVVASFACFVGVIVYLMMAKIVSFEIAKLMLVALLGLYVGLGVLIAAYRLMGKLQ